MEQRKSKSAGGGLEDNVTLWATKAPNNLTKQINGSDCGMHTCINIEILANQNPGTLEEKLNYPMSRDQSAATRKKLEIEILTGSLLKQK